MQPLNLPTSKTPKSTSPKTTKATNLLAQSSKLFNKISTYQILRAKALNLAANPSAKLQNKLDSAGYIVYLLANNPQQKASEIAKIEYTSNSQEPAAVQRGNNLNLNGSLNSQTGTPIVCRQIAFTQLIMERTSRELNHYQAFQKINFLMENVYDREKIQSKANRYLHISLEDDSFARAIADLAQEMHPGSSRFLIFFSENHAFRLQISNKKDRFEILYSDPNRTAEIAVALFASKEAILNFKFSDFVEIAEQKMYFPKFSSGLIAIYDNPKDNFKDRPIVENNLLLTNDDFKNKQLNFIFARLYFALAYNDPTSIRDAFQSLLKLTPDGAKFIKFSLKNISSQNGCPALHYALQIGNDQAIKAFNEMLFLVQEKLDAATVAETYYAKDPDGVPGLYFAMQEGHHKALLVTLEGIAQFKARLDPVALEDLLSAHLFGLSGLHIAMKNGNAEVVKAFFSGIHLFCEQLDSNALFRLFMAYNKNQIPGPIYSPSRRAYRGHKSIF